MKGKDCRERKGNGRRGLQGGKGLKDGEDCREGKGLRYGKGGMEGKGLRYGKGGM